jgi:hypothetical protein
MVLHVCSLQSHTTRGDKAHEVRVIMCQAVEGLAECTVTAATGGTQSYCRLLLLPLLQDDCSTSNPQAKTPTLPSCAGPSLSGCEQCCCCCWY